VHVIPECLPPILQKMVPQLDPSNIASFESKHTGEDGTIGEETRG